MRRRTMAAAFGALVALAPAAHAGTGQPQITDVEGDANGLPLSNLSTAPVSYGPADIVAVTLQTDYQAIPVGADGIDYRATGLVVRWKTAEVPASDGPTIEFALSVSVSACPSMITAYVTGPLSATDGRNLSGIWHRNGSCSGGGPINVGGGGDSVWFRATVLPATSEIVLTIPFDSLTEEEAALMKVGAALTGPTVRTNFSPQVETPVATLYSGGATIDNTLTGQSFVLGSDMPADVACTQGCP